MLSIFCAPARYVQGRDATSSLGAEIKKLSLGDKAFVIAGPSAKALLEDAWMRTFKASGIRYDVVEFLGECTRKEIDRLSALASENGSNVIIGAGGGKVLDTARAVASNLSLPIVNCPTVASSDAPCSALSVVYTESGEMEEYLFYPRNPDLVLVDTTIVAKAPVRLLVAGMGDALATMFEAKTVAQARKKNQVGGATTISASALADLCYRTLIDDSVSAIDAVRAGAVTPALERIVEANTLLSGLGFESGGLAIAHSVHNGLTVNESTHSYLHGEKVAFGLLVQLVAEGQSSNTIEEVLAYSLSVGLPTCLADVGISEPNEVQLRAIAERAVEPSETAHNEPFEVTAELILDAIKAADEIGSSCKETACHHEVEPQILSGSF